MENLYNVYKKLNNENQAFLKEEGFLIWAHHLHSGVDFTNPYLRIGKGFVFGKDDKIIARGFPKFFNYKQFSYDNRENLFPEDFVREYTEGFTDGKVYKCYEKLDGSLILVTEWERELFVTSARTSSEGVALEAKELLMDNGHSHLVYALKDKGITLVFEYVSPKNRIVIEYDKPELILLGLIVNESGEVIPPELFHEYIDYDQNFKIPNIKHMTLSDILNETMENESIEGYVVENDYGNMVKFKTNFWFKEKEAVGDLFFGDNITKRKVETLLEAYLDDSLDDLLALKNQKYPNITYIDEVVAEIYKVMGKITSLADSSKDNQEVNQEENGHLAYFLRKGNKDRVKRGVSKILLENLR